jgi:hypothetical protein
MILLPLSKDSHFLRRAVTSARVLRFFAQNGRILPFGIAIGFFHSRNLGKSIRLNFDDFEVETDSLVQFQRLRSFYDMTSNAPHLEHCHKF